MLGFAFGCVYARTGAGICMVAYAYAYACVCRLACMCEGVYADMCAGVWDSYVRMILRMLLCILL